MEPRQADHALVTPLLRELSEVKTEIGIQFGAGGGTSADVLQTAGTRGLRLLLDDGRRFLSAGVDMLMIEAEGITENVSEWRTDVTAAVRARPRQSDVRGRRSSRIDCYVQTFGAYVNLFVDRSQIVQLEALRRGIWGTTRSWRRVATKSDMAATFDIAVVGGINIDRFAYVETLPRSGGIMNDDRFLESAGGKGANRAVAAAKLGVRMAMIGCTGEDREKEEQIANLREAGIDTTHVRRVPGARTGAALIRSTRREKQIAAALEANRRMTADDSTTPVAGVGRRDPRAA